MIETTLTGKTPDIGEENIKKLMTMFPEVVTEGKVDFEKLKQVLGEYVDDSNERYNFTWNGKGRALRLSQTPSLGTLRPCKEESKNWDTTQNLYIEGDNLEVLKLLQKSYYGKIKMIYIDPPYNTGKDFVYKDDFYDSIENYKRITGQIDGNGKPISTNTETSGRYHTDWLNMMYPRLRLARNLLTDDGVIFISIDDNELDNLKKICNEVFGEDNFIAQLNIITGANQSGEGVNIQKNVEYCLVYAKRQDLVVINKVDKTQETFRNLNDAPTPLETRPDMGYTVYYNENTNDMIPVKDYDKEKIYLNVEEKVYTTDKSLISRGYIPIRPGMRNKKLHRWRWGFETFLERKDEITILKKNGKYGIYFKQEGFNAAKNYHNFSAGTIELKNLFDGTKVFDYPKNSEFIKYLTKLGSNSDSVVLDFFSGAATTAHAVMQLNAEDSGNRKFIMVQLPEPTDEKSEAYKAGYKNICDIGKERIRRAGEKIKEENKDKEGIENLDVGFKVFKLDTSNIRKWQPDYDNLEQSLMDYVDNFVEGRTELDVVYEIMLKYGLDLTYPVDEFTIAGKKVYSIGYGMLMICLDNEITTEVAKGILTKIKELSPESSRVVFKDNGFKTDSNKTNIKEILKSGGIEEFITI
jgi:adenine-specific DNA-methyltransferase